MQGSFDSGRPSLFMDDEGFELRDDLEIIEEYLGGVPLPSLVSAGMGDEDVVWEQESAAGYEETPTEVPEPAVQEAAAPSFTTSTMAEIYVSQGFIQRAIDIYEEMLKDNPTNDGIVNRIGELYEMLSPPEVAPEPIEVATQSAPIMDSPVTDNKPEAGVVATLEQWLANISNRRQ